MATGKKSKKKTGEKRSFTKLNYDQIMDLDLPDAFADLIRERSFYAVLEAFKKACGSRADIYRQRLLDEADPHPMTRARWEEELEFFNDATDALLDARLKLEAEWGNRAPATATGHISLNLTSERQQVAFNRFISGLFDVLENPAASAEQKQGATARLAKEMQGCIWTSKETGAPDFELAKFMHQQAEVLNDPVTAEDDRRVIIGRLKPFFALAPA